MERKSHYGSLLFWLFVAALLTTMFPGLGIGQVPADINRGVDPVARARSTWDAIYATKDSSNVTASASWRSTLGIPNHNLVTVDESGTVTAGADLKSVGYVYAGSGDANSVGLKFKKFVGASPSSEGGVVTFAHGGTVGKVHIVSSEIQESALRWPPETSAASGYAERRYNVHIDNADVVILAHADDSGSIINSTYTVILAYEP